MRLSTFSIPLRRDRNTNIQGENSKGKIARSGRQGKTVGTKLLWKDGMNNIIRTVKKDLTTNTKRHGRLQEQNTVYRSEQKVLPLVLWSSCLVLDFFPSCLSVLGRYDDVVFDVLSLPDVLAALLKLPYPWYLAQAVPAHLPCPSSLVLAVWPPCCLVLAVILYGGQTSLHENNIILKNSGQV
jgi:hypothetical protein